MHPKVPVKVLEEFILKYAPHPEDLLIIYESEAEQWASYLRFHLVGPISEAGICCYDIALVTSRRDDFLRLGGYKCKLLILSRGMLEGLCQLRRFFLARVLRPETSVVILLCGVESLDPLLELVPLKGEQCLQISSEQEPQDYRLTVAEIVHKETLMYKKVQFSNSNSKTCSYMPKKAKKSILQQCNVCYTLP
ncbi:B-cell scaffold protein [Labeo rohita]|uniref:B-cell scaffold protein n=1 Tax=Labeo rohita TaxID=84645 RepID=A0A498NVZ4_LABRO|nr:B-cell scaffold protein [Labeo rohita]